MIPPTIYRTNVQVVDAALAATPEILVEELSPAVMEGQLLVERAVRDRTPTSGAGTLRDSIGAMPIVMDGATVSGAVGTALAYAQPVELGARPHRPPIAPLEDWVQRKLGKKGKEARSVAFAIASKIAKVGTPARNMFADGLAETQGQVGEILTEAADRALRRVSQ